MNTAPQENQTDPSRRSSSEELNREIDQKTRQNLQDYRNKLSNEKVSERIEELDKEWDIDRTLIANASTLSLTGVILGATVDKKWFMVPGVVTSFLLWHAIQGWCPPLPVFRKLGYRTRKEIDTEKYALKALRGDFSGLETPGNRAEEGKIDQALEAAKK
ncbi:hypothetical protein Q0590_23490 [Rhodocytophaga aerolata]|uniref:DUF2892 domain-containing protein n=1 Tax=Rhodocytophaga aerolata TaxID=455078 RepID=A0ABT8RC37_9BACT|nr:hypothetical protein [Rhodocytophaga aerolata]MDO1449261.1 hypothetical protein [Rhodocytophaga aerolata]